MSGRGRPNTPDSLLHLRQSRHARETVKLAEMPALKMPKLTDGEQAYWNELEPALRKAGRLQPEDATALKLLCNALWQADKCTDEDKRLWQKQAMEFAACFGLYPAARLRLGFPSNEKPLEPESRTR